MREDLMSDNNYDIKVDDLILFFRARDNDNKEVVVNRLISHRVYTDADRKISIDPSWKDVVLSEPCVPESDDQRFYVVNLARLVPPGDGPVGDVKELPPDFWSDAAECGTFAEGDLVVFPPEDPESCFHLPRTVVNEKCPELPSRDISDLEFMASEEGAVLANVPKPVPQGCTCILLSLVSLRSGMLKDSPLEAAKTKLAKSKLAEAKTARAPAAGDGRAFDAKVPELKTLRLYGRDTKQYVEKFEHGKLVFDAIRRGHKL
jgi:hypothetical protein